MLWWAFCLPFISYITLVNGGLSCLNEDGKAVDMFVLYKLPRMDWIHEELPPFVKEGHGYTYLDKDSNYKFHLSKTSIADDSSVVGRTMDQLYKPYKHADGEFKYSDEMAHVLYNDENPNGEKYFDCGHTKGGIVFDRESGFWLIHSVPKYLNPVKDGYSYPHSGCKFGQMFLCLSFNASSFDKIGLQLRFDNPHVHDSNLPEQWEDMFPNIQKLIKGEMMVGHPTSHVQPLTTLAGEAVEHFAKNNDFGHDLYHNLVAPKLKSNLFVETWQYGTKIGPSCNGSYTVLDIQKLSVDVPEGSFAFDVYNDHSKYVVTDDKKSYHVCIGDINREPSQFKRGGGTMCLQNEMLWSTFRNMIRTTNHC